MGHRMGCKLKRGGKCGPHTMTAKPSGSSPDVSIFLDAEVLEADPLPTPPRPWPQTFRTRCFLGKLPEARV